MTFPTLRIEGNLLSQELLERVESGDGIGQSPTDFGLDRSAKVRDLIADAWVDAKDYWRIFQRQRDRLQDKDSGVKETREVWILPLFRLLGYNSISFKRSAEIVNDKAYPISHAETSLDNFPLTIVSFKQSLDTKEGRYSPHGMAQEYVNVTEHLYTLVTNGLQLRLLRDSGKLVKLSFVEFDLQKMFDEDCYSDFALMFRLLHATRMPRTQASTTDSIIEKYHQDTLDSGSRIRDGLSKAVERSLLALGTGFLSHPANEALRLRFTNGQIDADRYFQSLLRLIYRMLFLIVIEDRNLVFSEVKNEGSEAEGRRYKQRLYTEYYSISRLRRLAEKLIYAEEQYDDLWLSLVDTFRLYEDDVSAAPLSLTPLDGELFSEAALRDIEGARLTNKTLLECIRALTVFEHEKSKRTIRVNYASLNVEEFGSVYEGLLEFKAEVRIDGEHSVFSFVQGTERSKSGSHYTPDELVHPLINNSLAHVIEAKKAEAAQEWQKNKGRGTSKTLAEIEVEKLLSISVCDVACGSGHILLAAARRIGMEVARARTGEEQPNPAAYREAVRDAIRRCIYGVDKNPLAVELCRVALWLEAHNAGKPLTFLDHRIKCGDALVGTAREEDLFRGIRTEAFAAINGDSAEAKKAKTVLRKRNDAELKGVVALDFGASEAESLGAVRSTFHTLSEAEDSTLEQAQALRQAYSEASSNRALQRLKYCADIQCAMFFNPCTPETLGFAVTQDAWRSHLDNRGNLRGNVVGWCEEQAIQRRFFHWFLEFPDVFEKGGFDCIVGNPPFLGGQRLSGTFGNDYLKWLTTEYAPAGAMDFVGFFFRRIFHLIRPNGFLALISTNTIAQGGTREGALDEISRQNGEIVFAVRSQRWPGRAAVEVAQLSIVKGRWNNPKLLDGLTVDQINTYLDDQEALGDPYRLGENANKSFQGSIVLGKGFVLDPEHAFALIAADPKNRDVLFPYLNGEDLNSTPDQSPSRWVINFFDWPLERSALGSWAAMNDKQKAEVRKSGVVPTDYPDPVASDYPDCLEILRLLVYDLRQKDNRKQYRDLWWQYAEKRGGLYRTIKPLERVLVVALTSKTVAFSFASSKIVFSHAAGVFALSSFSDFAILQSNLHFHWAWKNASTMKGDLRYTPSDIFETFPLPVLNENYSALLEMIGSQYYERRTDVMNSFNCGLTKIYNFIHDPKLMESGRKSKDFEKVVTAVGRLTVSEASDKVNDLRNKHVEMDLAVLTAYGWQDIELRHDFYEVEFLPENDRVRYTIHIDARKEILKRLLALNHERYEEEIKMSSKGKTILEATRIAAPGLTDSLFSHE